MSSMGKKMNNHGFIRVASAAPVLKVANPDFNTIEIIKVLKNAEFKKVSLVVFPELSISGYTAADLFFQKALQTSILENLGKLINASKKLKPLFIIGLPLAFEGKLFNVAALVGRGQIFGIVPKTYIPGYKEFYEERWFASARDLTSKEISVFNRLVPFGTDILFNFKDCPGAVLGVEICEDLWVPLPPSSLQSLKGATIIVNPSASNDLVGKADYRRELIKQQSARTIAGYIYASSGIGESSTDLVFGGHALIVENGNILKESKRFKKEGELIISEIDIEHLMHDREKTTSFGESIHESVKKDFRVIDLEIKPYGFKKLFRYVDPSPFIPGTDEKLNERVKEIFSIQVAALAKRLETAKIRNVLIGLSGGLDSTLVLLVAVKAVEFMGLKKDNIHTFTMPGFGTSLKTNKNAKELARALGVKIEEIDIKKGVSQQLRDLKHREGDEDLAYENAQARYRTLTLMDKANQLKGLVLGTGDLSEIALGWTTYTGDHISHYNVNCGIPKTLVKHLVNWIAGNEVDKKTAKVIRNILAIPFSPELKRSNKGDMGHKTEDIIGPYELHDFFLYHFLRWGSNPKKILYLANLAWGQKYSDGELKKWLRIFLTRFFGSQWKRSVATDGPKVGSVSLSPRGDWRMPSDADVSIWLK